MNYKNKRLLMVSIMLLLSTALFADKPIWAGNGGKPSDCEKQEHKEDMTSKHKYKEYKKHHKEDEEYSHKREYDSRDIVYGEQHDTYYDKTYEGQGQTDKAFIEEKTDETKKNWIGKFFDFLN